MRHGLERSYTTNDSDMDSEIRASYHRSGLALGVEHRKTPNRVGFVASLLSNQLDTVPYSFQIQR